LQHLLTRPIDSSFETKPLPEPLNSLARPVLKVHSLSAGYRDATGQFKPTLHDVEFQVLPGECIGIAGQSGGGKSSMIKILLRLLHKGAGTVSLCGEPIEAVDRQSLADTISYVGQNPFVFAGTIRDNIAYGCNGADQAAIEKAATSLRQSDDPDDRASLVDITPLRHNFGVRQGSNRRVRLVRKLGDRERKIFAIASRKRRFNGCRRVQTLISSSASFIANNVSNSLPTV